MAKLEAMILCNSIWVEQGNFLELRHRCVREDNGHKIHRCFCGRNFTSNAIEPHTSR